VTAVRSVDADILADLIGLVWVPGDGFWVPMLILVIVRMLMPILTPTLMAMDMEDNLSIAMIHRGYGLWQKT
jgi:hypothetical protein